MWVARLTSFSFFISFSLNSLIRFLIRRKRPITIKEMKQFTPFVITFYGYFTKKKERCHGSSLLQRDCIDIWKNDRVFTTIYIYIYTRGETSFGRRWSLYRVAGYSRKAALARQHFHYHRAKREKGSTESRYINWAFPSCCIVNSIISITFACLTLRLALVGKFLLGWRGKLPSAFLPRGKLTRSYEKRQVFTSKEGKRKSVALK